MRNRFRGLRIGVGAALLVLFVLAPMVHIEAGSLCIFCPVGFLEVAVASRSIPLAHLPYLVAGLLIAVLLGRAFCAWICPTGLLKNVFGGRAPRGIFAQTGCVGCSGDCSESGDERTALSGRMRSDLLAQGIVLAVLLVVSLIVRFPVFCLFCPIGLAMGVCYGIARVFLMWQFGWELILFPAMLVAEVFLFRRWCSKICPLGFFLGLAAAIRRKLGFGVTVRSDASTCLAGKGCYECLAVCPEDISVPAMDGSDRADCTLCLQCKEHCPAQSISIKLGKIE